MHSRNQYLETLIPRYLKADRKGKSSLLDEYCLNTGQNRKYAIRKISHMAFKEPKPRKKRAVRYGHEVREALWKLWKIFDGPCGQRLKPLLEPEVKRLKDLGELKISDETNEKLLTVSSATIDRLLRSKKEGWKLQRRYGSRKSGLISKRIPLRLTDWDTERVGYVEMDMVFHCGSSTAGEFVSSLSTLEISSGWWEAEAVMGRAQSRTFEALKAIRRRSPFLWLGIDSDNDQMFINHQLFRYCEQEQLEFTRSRPHRKNDNAYIEQKNYTHVRRPLGYLRYDTEEELHLINDLYRNELRLFKNFFQPVMKLRSKERVDGKPRRKYDTAKTPYQRLIESGHLSLQAQKVLKELYSTLNPAELKREIDRKLDRLYEAYQKKNKRSLRVNPYKKQTPSTVTFLMIQQ
ncbi:MAG: transposase [Acidobacteriota bacterium]|nr:transposase [Acidobacteriota bacterium]